MAKVNILGVQIDSLTQGQVVDRIKEHLAAHQRLMHIVTPNPEMVVAAQTNKIFCNVLNRAELAIPDGIGLLMAGDYLQMDIPNRFGHRELQMALKAMVVSYQGLLSKEFNVFPERVSGVDLFYCLLTEIPGLKVFLLGGEGGVVAEAVDALSQKFPQVNIVGAEEGGIVAEDGVGAEDENVIDQINQAAPDFLLVSFRAPAQDLWIDRNRDRLKAKVAMGAGGTIDFIAGKQKRAPSILSVHALEWVWRGMIEPRRWKRIWKAFPVFPLYVAKYKLNMIKSQP